MASQVAILQEGDPALAKVSQACEPGEDVSDLLSDMWVTMLVNNGIGLAANQIGVMKRVIVMKVGRYKLEIINPEIESTGGGKRTTGEGCLSFPGKERRVNRARNVMVTGFDADWNPIRKKLKGIAARVVQHEVDHLNGVTIYDH